jgi:hypothetical protein
MMIARHGGESHFVRPDRVYKTGVLTPIGGFQPQADVMAVAQSFTLGPAGFMQGGLNGVQFLGPMSWFQRAKLKFQMWRASKNAAAFKNLGGLGFTPYGPAMYAAGNVVPMPMQRIGMLLAMQEKDQPPQIAMNNTALIQQRFNYMRSPSR